MWGGVVRLLCRCAIRCRLFSGILAGSGGRFSTGSRFPVRGSFFGRRPVTCFLCIFLRRTSCVSGSWPTVPSNMIHDR